MMPLRTIFFYIFLFLVSTTPAFSADNPLAPIKLDTPRDTMRSFMDAINDFKKGVDKRDDELKRRINDAIRCLNLEQIPFVSRQEKGKKAAILLKEVIDRVIVIDYEKIPDFTGDDSNSLLRWRLKGTEITISRVESGDRAGEYLFSPGTIDRAEEFFEKVRHLGYLPKSGMGARYRAPFIEQVIPDWARTETLKVPNWKWIGLFAAILAGLIVKKILEYIVGLLKRVAGRTSFDWDDQIVQAAEKPAGLIGASASWFIAIFLLQFEGILEVILSVTVQIFFSISVVWLVYRLVDVIADYLSQLSQKTASTLDDQLVPLVRKALKIFVVVFGILVTCQNLGINVLSVLAGLGLGGLAFALAAKDTCANFFGSIMILIDRPFNIGDWIIADKVEGTVEEIGFRSTRVRTFYNSVMTVPNSVLANANIDNMGERQYRRIKAFFGLKYDTPAEKMEAFLEGLKNIIEANPYTRKDYFHVVFSEYGASSLNVMLYCFLKVPDWGVELVERQNIYLEILRFAEKLGVEFAFPTQTLHMETFPGHVPTVDLHEIDTKELREKANSFGPGGDRARPGGSGIFKPPYVDNIATRGSDDNDG